MKDVDCDLRPITTYLMSLGMEVGQIGRLACVYPRLLLCSVEGQIKPLIAQLTAAGASTQQVCVLPESQHRAASSFVNHAAWLVA